MKAELLLAELTDRLIDAIPVFETPFNLAVRGDISN